MTESELSQPQPDFADPPVVNPYRLPGGVSPVRYDLTLLPDLPEARFTGTVITTLDVAAPTTELVCNSIDLEIDGAWVIADPGARLDPTAIDLDADTERVTFRFAAPIPSGRVVLHTEFKGELNDKLRGFYRSTFTDDAGVEQTIATTQFEATDARRAFPCWDEPEHKAVFGITLVIDHDEFAVSNAAEVSRTRSTIHKDHDVVIFADTMKMSTYLVAFIVGPLEATDPVDVDGTPLRVVYPRGKGHLTSYALEVGAACLRHFSSYYGISYPGDKLDLVAVPDFAFGAMENLGCVTFREILLLVDPATTTQAELLNVTDVINHELAHMWFGDLVTMKWWNGIWLNEAFATFMEMHATDAFRPEWERWVTFGLSRTAAFDTDALSSTRPIEYPVVSPAEAEGMFDILTYEKGAAVVRMLEQYLGADEFREGIRSYLTTHAYANTETTDLWDAIEAATGEPVRRIMDSWIFQGGFPMITVDLLDEGGTVRFTQQRFGYLGDIGEGDAIDLTTDDDQRWVVPLIFSQRSSRDGVVTFEKVLLEGETLDVDLIEPAEWILANTEGTGFYRIRYAPDLLAALVAHAPRDLSPIERYGLVDDVWAGVLAGDLSAHDFLDIAEKFGTETDLSVWQRLVAGLSALDRLVEGDARVALQARVRALLTPALDRLGADPSATDSDRDRALRGVLFEALGTLGHDDDARARARDLLADGAIPDPALAAAAVNIVASSGDAADFETFVNRMRSAANPQEEQRFLYALADFPDAELAGRLLAMTVTDEVRTQNAALLLRRALVNREQGPLAWSFVVDHWDDLNQRLPSNSIVRMLDGVRSLAQPDVAPKVFAFFEDHEVPQGDKSLAQHLERLEVNVAFRDRDAGDLTDALNHHHDH